MEGVLFAVVVVVLTIAWGLWHRRQRQRALAEHRARTRRIFGCLACGVELVPPARLWRCGRCEEDTMLCRSCFAPRCAWLARHPHAAEHWHDDPVYLERAWVVPEPLRLPQVLERAFTVWADRRLLGLPNGHWWSYAEMRVRIHNVCHALARAGVSQAHRVVVHCAAEEAFYLLQWACFRMGVVVVPINAGTPAVQVRAIIDLAEPTLVMSDSDWAPWPVVRASDVVQWAAHERHPAVPALPVTAVDDLAMLLPTSGSTGAPKLVVFTDERLSRHASQVAKHGSLMVLLSYGPPLRQAIDVLAKGGAIGLWSGSMEMLFADAARIRPTLMGGMPLFFEALRSRALAGEEVSHLLGNRCRTIVIGGAASSPELKKWLFTSMGAMVLDGYGSTETGGLALNGASDSSTLCLIDCPALGYLTSDSPPRGEIVSRIGEAGPPRYYRNDAATQECIVRIGNASFWRTGDIGVQTASGIQIIDRARNFFKLANGIFVAPAEVESVLSLSPLVRNVYVYPDPSAEFLVAACVPRSASCTEREVLLSFFKLGATHEHIAKQMPRRVVIDTDLWTVENGLLTAAGKVARAALKERFCGTNTNDHTALDALPPLSVDASACSSGLRVLLAEAGLSVFEGDTRLVAAGLNSMAMAQMINKVAALYGKRLSARQLAAMSVAELDNFVFGDGRSSVALAPVDWTSYVEEAWSAFDVVVPRAAQLHDGHVFLTGASGFVGAYLVNRLLADAAVLSVTCLVRAPDDASALSRVRDALALFGSAMPTSPHAQLLAVAGDLAAPNLGMTRERFEALARSHAWLCVHNGAMVDSIKPFAALAATNVGGTVTMARFAALSGVHLHHVSTIGVLSSSGVLDERPDVPSSALSHLSGYAQSKWVAEQCALRYAHTVVYRLGSIGGRNERDSINMMVRGIAALGRVCVSCVPRWLPIVPVEACASALVRLALAAPLQRRVFHVVSTTPVDSGALFAHCERVTVEQWRELLETADASNSLFFVRDSLWAEKNDADEPHALPHNDATTVVLGADWCPQVSVEQVFSWSHY